MLTFTYQPSAFGAPAPAASTIRLVSMSKSTPPASAPPVYDRSAKMPGGLPARHAQYYKLALALAQKYSRVGKLEVATGKLPYVKFTNLADGTTWGLFFNTSSKMFAAKPIRDTGRGYLGALAHVGPGIVRGMANAGEGLIKAVQVSVAVATGAFQPTPPPVPGRPQPMPTPPIFVPPSTAPSPTTNAVPETGGAGGSPYTSIDPRTKYPSGSLARFNRTRRIWSVYVPTGAGGGFGLASADGICLHGTCELGEAGTVNPPPPTGYMKVGEEVAQPAGIAAAGTEEDVSPWYKNPWIIGGIVVGTAALGTGAYFLLRRKQ